ncbi:MAG: 4'-phosphopantetheinyl transferase superfamily protein [Anaerolineae bacterium]|nr:4'-phosphopantetheinyl transferase superfamily protein [Anaerolineae bacterium]
MIDWLVCTMRDMSFNDEGTSPSFFLSATERQVYAGFKVEKRRREWLLGRWTAKQLLRRSQVAYAKLPLTAITVGNDADGAPYLAVATRSESGNPERADTDPYDSRLHLTAEMERLPICLSISHRGDKAFCALSDSHRIGADIERVEARQPVFVHDFFTEGENARIWRLQTRIRDTAITVMWSAKESVLKVLREGLRIDTRRVEVTHIYGLEQDSQGPDDTLSADGWRAVQVKCMLPDTPRFAAWWRPESDDVLTLAAALPDAAPLPHALTIRRAGRRKSPPHL